MTDSRGKNAQFPLADLLRQSIYSRLDSTEIAVYGEQEQKAYNGHFESTCYHPLLLFNSDGDCLAAKLRPGNIHSAESHLTRRLFASMLGRIATLPLPAG